MTETLENMRVLLAPLVVLVCGMVVLLLDLRRQAFAARKSLALTCQFGLFLAALACLPALGEAALAGVKILAADQATVRLFGDGMTLDGFGALLNLTLCLVAALVIGMSGRYLEAKKLPFGEFYALILFATAGAMVMVCSLPTMPKREALSMTTLRSRSDFDPVMRPCTGPPMVFFAASCGAS